MRETDEEENKEGAEKTSIRSWIYIYMCVYVSVNSMWVYELIWRVPSRTLSEKTSICLIAGGAGRIGVVVAAVASSGVIPMLSRG